MTGRVVTHLRHVDPPRRHWGRVVLIGDAVDTYPPTPAQGAALALEGALVLAELLTGADVLDDELLTGFAERGYAR